MNITTEQRREWGRQGGLLRAKTLTPEHQRAARAKVKRSSLQASGRKGFQGLVRNQGLAAAARQFANHRRKNPTSLELKVMNWLDLRDIEYQREVEIWYGQQFCFVDFLIGKLVIEVDGAHWHEQNDHHGEDRPSRDLIKEQICKDAGYQFARLSEAEMNCGAYLLRLAELTKHESPVALDVTESHS